MDISATLLDRLADTITKLVTNGQGFLDEGDLSVAACTLKDAADLQEVHGLLGRGETDVAIRRVNQLDTAAREEIPASVYKALMALA